MRTPKSAAWLLLVLLAAGCRGGTQAPAAGLIRIAHEGEPLSLDPAGIAEGATYSILSNFYDTLVAFDRDLTLVPSLALHWTTPDDRTWLLELRRGVRFHDGRLLRARDVKASLERARDDPVGGLRGQLSMVGEIELLGESTLRLHTLRPDPLLINRLAYVLIAPEAPRGHDWSRVVGTGPYRVVDWQPGVRLLAEAWDGWHGKPPIERAEFVTVEEGPESLEALRAGRVDVLRYVPETLAREVAQLPEYRLASRSGLLSFYLWLDTRPGRAPNPLADRRVRRALSLAIDRRALVAGLGGHGQAAHQLVQQGVFGHVAGARELPYDPAGARALLREAGYGAGLALELQHRSAASIAAVAALLRQQLAAVGVELRASTPPWPRLVADWKAGRVPFLLAGWYFESGDAMSFFHDCLATRAAGRGRGSFNVGYSNPLLDDLVDESRPVPERPTRLERYERLTRLALEDLPLVPLYHRDSLYGIARRVRFEPRLDGKLLAAEMSFAPPAR